jgi:hypothetical protein
MRIRKFAASIVIASASIGSAGIGFALGSTPANASGSVTETVSQSNVMLSSKCYREVRREVVYYTHSSTKGWVREPAPKVTTTISTHCYK